METQESIRIMWQSDHPELGVCCHETTIPPSLKEKHYKGADIMPESMEIALSIADTWGHDHGFGLGVWYEESESPEGYYSATWGALSDYLMGTIAERLGYEFAEALAESPWWELIHRAAYRAGRAAQ